MFSSSHSSRRGSFFPRSKSKPTITLESLEARNAPAVDPLAHPLLPETTPAEMIHLGPVEPGESLGLVGEQADSIPAKQPVVPPKLPASPVKGPQTISQPVEIQPIQWKRELDRHGRVTADPRVFGHGNHLTTSQAQSRQIVIRPGLVTPQEDQIEVEVPTESNDSSLTRLSAWGGVLAAGVAHTVHGGRFKRGLELESHRDD